MISVLVTTNNVIEPLRRLSAYTASPLFDLFLRLYVSWFFFNAGLIKLSATLNGEFSSVVEKFDWIYPVTLFGTQLDPTTAAIGSLFGEIALPILLALGLFSRFAAIGLFIMTAVIQFGTDVGVLNESILLFVMSGSLFLKGPGFFSLDHLFVSILRARSAVMPSLGQQLGLWDIQSDIPGHEASGRFVRALATGFWYTIIGLGLLHLLVALIDLIPAISISPFVIVDVFSRISPETALLGYCLAIAFSFITGLIYAVLSLKHNVVFTPQKSIGFGIGTALLFMIFYGVAIA